MEHPTSIPLKSVNSLSAWFTNTVLPRSPIDWRCYQRHWRTSIPGARAATLVNSLALLSMPLAGTAARPSQCKLTQRRWRASIPGARAATLANSLALLSASLAGFDSGGASCHARQQPGVVISVISGHSGPALPGGKIALLSTPLAGTAARPSQEER